MVSKEIIVNNHSGLHARPATLLVKKASTFKSDISIEYKGKKANVKSLINVLSLGVPKEAVITIVSSGNDEVLALEEICRLIDALQD